MPASSRVLVAEDDPDTCDLLYEALTRAGAQVSVASSGHAAFDAFTRDTPDVVVSDLKMPDGDGYELIRRIRSLPQEEGGLVPAIAMSTARNVDSALQAGFHAFVSKPLDLEAIVDQLSEWVRTDGDPRSVARWTIRPGDGELLTLTLDGHIRQSDMRSMMATLLSHLKSRPCDLVVDAQRCTGFSPDAPSMGQRSLWAARHQVRYVLVVGAPRTGRNAVAASCKVLGIPCAFAASS